MIPRIFDGETVIVCAGGPSLRGFQFSRLAGLNVVAINKAYVDVPGAAVLWWSDARFWRNHKEGIEAHSAQWKATCAVNYSPQDGLPDHVHKYPITAVDGFDTDPSKMRSGNNSAYASIHLAVHLGASKIILLGVDMRHGDHGETHYHGGHGFPHREDTLTTLMVPHFATLVTPLKQRGIEVVNASPNSKLTCWPRCTIDEALGSISPCRFDQLQTAL